MEILLSQTRQNLLLVAPFIKANTIRRILGSIDDSVIVQIVTRWRVDEIAMGVSDLDVYLQIRDHPNRTLWLRPDLHAKYYRADQQALIGSANLTDTGLGWTRKPNLELLIESPSLVDFEEELFRASVLVDDTIYHHVKECVELMPKPIRLPIDQPILDLALDNENSLSVAPTSIWLPQLRHPENFYSAYAGDIEEFGIATRSAAISDLSELGIPDGLNKEQFDAYVSTQLLQNTIIQQVDHFVETSQRFGAVRDFLQTLPCGEQEDFDATIAWQTLMRWLLHFLPKRYERTVPRHSEIFQKIV